MNNNLRLSVWSGPRNVSTALMYSFRQRPDTKVFDEPLYGHYLKTFGVKHPGYKEVMKSMDCDGKSVIENILLAPLNGKSVFFFKNMAHHLRDLNDLGFLDELTNVLLTRAPREMLPSLAKKLPEPSLSDTGLVEQIQLLEQIKKSGKKPVVLDARELLLNPESVLHQLCERLDIPFDQGMLQWPAGPKPEDGIWAKYWYENVHASTKFKPYRPKTRPFPKKLRPLLEKCKPLYDRLYEYALRSS
ncbi:MAG TPA: sulfotransferase family protein [Balneolaceae bacterium]|nr:sulfotransferase family protein [Balneolaceae bacterium]